MVVAHRKYIRQIWSCHEQRTVFRDAEKGGRDTFLRDRIGTGNITGV